MRDHTSTSQRFAVVRVHLAAFCFLLLLGVTLPAAEVSEATLRRKLRDLQDDDVRWNCDEAIDFLTPHLDEKRVQLALIRCLDSKDAQVRESAIILLCSSSTYQPTEHFVRVLLERMKNHGDLAGFAADSADETGADFLISRAARFGDLIAAEVADRVSVEDGSLWYQYAIVRAMAKGGILQRYRDRFKESFLKSLGIQLMDDDIAGNAKTATAMFLFLGDIGVPTLQKLQRVGDKQAKRVAKLILMELTNQISIKTLCERLGSSEFIGFDEGALDECDLKRDVVRLPKLNPHSR